MDEAHTYFVGDGQWLVHNCGGPDGNPNKRDRTLDEFKEESARIRQEHDIDPLDKNVGIADYDIDGVTGTLPAISGGNRWNLPGFAPFRRAKEMLFRTFSGGGGLGNNDTEAKILEELARRFNPNSSGRIVLYTDRPPCPSCSGVIEQFKERHPNIQIELIKGDLPLNRRPD